jgi:hypothetical protein
MNKAATAPMWNMSMKSVVKGLIGCVNVLSFLKMLITASVFSSYACVPSLAALGGMPEVPRQRDQPAE